MTRRGKTVAGAGRRATGDYFCPLNPRHGALLFHAEWSRLYCPHSDHDGRPAHGERDAVVGSGRWFATTEALTSLPAELDEEKAA